MISVKHIFLLAMLRNAFGLSKRLLFACNQQLFVANKNYCASSNGPNANLEPKIEPVSLSYNSYEDVVATKTAAPVIIMHGRITGIGNRQKLTKIQIIYFLFSRLFSAQVFSVRSKIGEAFANR